MKLFIVAVFVVACGTVVLCDTTTAAPGQVGNSTATLHNLKTFFLNLGVFAATGDVTRVIPILKSGQALLSELMQKINSGQIGEDLTKMHTDITQLIEKLSSGEGSIDDVKAFMNNAKNKLKQRIADRM